MNFINTNPELQRVFEQNKKKPIVNEQLPATPIQVLAERLFPLVSMLVLLGIVQMLSAFYFDPMETSVPYANIAGVSVVEADMPFAIQVRNTRVGKGMSRQMLAQKVGLTYDNITAIEEGDATPTKEIEFALQQVLGLEPMVLHDNFVANP